MYKGVKQGFWFAVTVLVVCGFVSFISYWSEKRTAEALNEKLRERRKQNS